MNLQAMLAGGLLLLGGLGLSGLSLVRAQARHERFRSRMDAVVAPHVPSRQRQATLRRTSARTPREDFWHRAAGVLGFSPDRPELYPVRWWIIVAAAAVLARIAVGLLSNVAGPGAYVLIVPAALWLSRWFFRHFARRYANTLFTQFPDALGMIVRSVRVGIPVSEAIRIVARESPQPTARAFGRLSDEIAIGVPLEDAVRRMGEFTGLPEYRFFGTALSLQAQTGGGLAETIETLADVIRKRVALKARGKALASEANTSAGVLTALPGVAALGLYLINPSYIEVLFSTPEGKRLVAVAVGLLSTGTGIMRMTIRKSLS